MNAEKPNSRTAPKFLRVSRHFTQRKKFAFCRLVSVFNCFVSMFCCFLQSKHCIGFLDSLELRLQIPNFNAHLCDRGITILSRCIKLLLREKETTFVRCAMDSGQKQCLSFEKNIFLLTRRSWPLTMQETRGSRQSVLIMKEQVNCIYQNISSGRVNFLIWRKQQNV